MLLTAVLIVQVRQAEAAGALAVIVVDNQPEVRSAVSQGQLPKENSCFAQTKTPPELFTMSGDGGVDPAIGAAFLHRNNGRKLVEALHKGGQLRVTMRRKAPSDERSSPVEIHLIFIAV